MWDNGKENGNCYSIGLYMVTFVATGAITTATIATVAHAVGGGGGGDIMARN